MMRDEDEDGGDNKNAGQEQGTRTGTMRDDRQ